MSTVYWEFDHSPIEQHLADGSFIAKRRLGCAWDDRYALLNEMSGGASSIYPYNSLGAGAVSATIIPFNDTGGAIPAGSRVDYGTAVVTVTYAITSYYPHAIGGRMMVEEMHPALEYWTVPTENLHVGATDGDEPDSPGRVIVPVMDYTLTCWGYAGVKTETMGLMGYKNQAIWYTHLLGVQCAPETLLFIGPTPRIEARMGLSLQITISLAFKYRPVASWGKQLTANGWQYIYNDDGDLLVPSGDFRWLQPSWL